MNLHRTPLLRLLPPFLVGILCAPVFAFSLLAIVAGLCLSVLPLVYFVMAKNSRQSKISLSYGVGLFVYAALFFAGSAAAYFSDATHAKNHLIHQKKYNTVLLRVVSTPQATSKTYKIIAEAQWVYSGDSAQPTTGKVLLYLSKKGYDSTLRYGDFILVNNTLSPPPPPQNPASFDYAQWLARQNIYHQAFLQAGTYTKTQLHQANYFFALAYNARTYFDNVLHTYLPHSATYSIAGAILLGLRNTVDDSLVAAYARTGTIHILAVSGLHVGVIYLGLVLLLGWLGKHKSAQVLRAIIVVVCLWGYALLTGLSPSVVRAVIMFSFIAVGKAMQREANLFNTLSAAALFTLCFDSNAIYQVGFQLSYLAVAGIGLLYPVFYGFLTPKIKILSWAWQLVCVSLAAQLATFPLGIFYFHQFPNYFLLSNLLIVPLGIAAVYLGVVLLLVSPINAVAVWVGKGLHIVLWCCNGIAQSVQGFPFAYSSNLYLSAWGVLAIYGSMGFGFLYLKTKKLIVLGLAIVCAIGLMGLALQRNYATAHTQQFTIYSLPQGQKAISYIYQNEAIVWADSSISASSPAYIQNIAPHFINSNIKKVVFADTISTNNFSIYGNGVIALHELKILWLTPDTDVQKLQNLTFDVVVFDANPTLSVAQEKAWFGAKIVVFTANNSRYRINNWVQQARQLNIKYYSIPTQGAYTIDLNT